MKIISLVFAVLVTGCGIVVAPNNEISKSDVIAEDTQQPIKKYIDNDSLYLSKFMKPGHIPVIDAERKLAVRYIDSCNMDTIAYNSIERIDKELYDLCYRASGYEDWEIDLLAINRLEFHLSNPLTFTKSLPSTNLYCMEITTSPDRKYKFYSLYIETSVSGSIQMVYMQYRDKMNVVRYKEILQDEAYRGIVKLWQFRYNNDDYYVIKSQGGSSGGAGCFMEIVTIDNVEITYYNDYYPYKFQQCGTSNVICWSDDWERMKVDYTFNPTTLTINAKDVINGKLVNKSWKLKMPY